MINVDLKAGDFVKEFPKDADLEAVIQFKLGSALLERISPLESIEVVGEYLRVSNYLSEYRYKYRLKDLKKVVIIVRGMF